MRIEEMIKELRVNPDKKFKNSTHLGTVIAYMEEGKVRFKSIDKGLIVAIHVSYLNDEWEEVKEPVDFMTAVRSGKHIGVEFSGVKYKPMSLPNLLYELQQDHSHRTICQFILNGKWYIED